MKIGIDWSQPSTIRGLVWTVGGVMAALFAWLGKDSTQIMAITAAMAGGLGVAVKD